MRKKTAIYVLTIGLLIAFFSGCDKEDKTEVIINLPEITTATVTQVSSTEAVSGGEIINNGGSKITASGVCWSRSENPTISDNKTNEGIGTGNYISNITGLIPETTYYTKAYATNSKGTAYGKQMIFTTSKEIILPTITTSNVTNITESNATLGGEVTFDGNTTLIDRGVVFATTKTPTLEDNKLFDGKKEVGTFSVEAKELKENTSYYARAFATNSKGTAYGEEVNFTTAKEIILPTITTSDVFDITKNSAKLGGKVTSDGNTDIIDCGIVYSVIENPTKDDIKVSADIKKFKDFNVSVSGLSPNTKYYVRAYAVNSMGTVYGNQVIFTTAKEIVLPTLTTSQIVNIGDKSATMGGGITFDGNADIIDCGIVYSTLENPTTIDIKIAANIQNYKEFNLLVSGLSPNTKYYVRAYATNSKGTAYGDQESFTTSKEILLATVVTSPAINITETRASLGGEVTSDGNADIIECGIVYSAFGTPTIDDFKLLADIEKYQQFLVSVSELKADTKYYVRAFAKNKKGISYGDLITFTTKKEETPIIGVEVANITSKEAEFVFSILSLGSKDIEECGVLYYTRSNGNNDNVKRKAAIQNPNVGTSSVKVTGLIPSEYYFVDFYINYTDGSGFIIPATKYFKTLDETINDARDGNVYKTVKIGNQVWMTENLRYLPVVHSDYEFKNVGQNQNPGYGVLKYNGSNLSTAKTQYNYKTYGVLYNVYAVQKGNICPKGWHVPSLQEWESLFSYLGGSEVAGGKLKESGTAHWVSPNEGATNESGFNALPAGLRNEDGVSFMPGSDTYIWSSVQHNPNSTYSINLGTWMGAVHYTSNTANRGHSVRCIRD